MFEHSAAPRVFYVPPGADFPAAVIAGLATRLKAPDAWARTHILCNAGRMVSRLREVLEEGPPRLLPRLSLITDLKSLAPHLTSAPPVAGLRRQLDLARDLRAISGLAAPLDIARALAVLLDEMDGEGVPFARLQDLDVSDQSGHWARALAIVQTAAAYKPGLGPEAVYRAQVLDLIDAWQDAPPAHPVLVAGSTGSRGTTARLMQAVARLPQGALILPGFDPNTPQNVWKELWEKRHEDHPQFRYAALLHTLELDPKAIEPWAGSLTPNPERADFLSLALRPAPVTHHWRRDSPKAADLSRATDDITLVEAKDQRAEATAIALRLREAVEAGQRAALISPDRGLTRRVAAALARWDLVPDDSAGVPLSLTPPGRLLSQIARLGTQGVAADTLIALLKHPLVSTGANRGEHLLKTRALELKLRRKGPPFPTPVDVATWAEEDPTRTSWGAWLGPLLAPNDAQTLPDHLAWLMHATETLCAGPEAPETTGALWEEAPGRAAKATLEAMTEVSAPEDTLSAQDFTVLLGQTLAAESLRIQNEVTPGLMIWGTLEARAQGADLVVLGGLNDGIWPAAPDPDPWMNRAMRHSAGLLSPERQIGLAAHDFQQAAGAPKIWLTRATKSDDAETVPSRWLNRITTLLGGLTEQGGEAALKAMRARGDAYLTQAARLDLAPHVAPAVRPSPVPPPATRPKRLSVTEIRTLIRDPYAIYAKHILRLRELDPLAQSPDARLRGIVLHDVLERVVATLPDDPDAALAVMEDTAAKVLRREVPWPAARTLWQARLMRAAPWFIRTEATRRAGRAYTLSEATGRLELTALEFTLTGKADRIDMGEDGQVRLYDYKTGNPPSADEQRHFDKQLPLEAVMIERGGFEALGQAPVARAAYIGLGATPQERDVDLTPDYWAEFTELITRMRDPDHGFTARRAMQKDSDESPYDLLSRFGEWGPSDPAEKMRL